jgi:hypothetical protein
MKSKVSFVFGMFFLVITALYGNTLHYDFVSDKGEGLTFTASEGCKKEEVLLENKKGAMFTPAEGRSVELSLFVAGDDLKKTGPVTIELEYLDRADSLKIVARKRIEGRGDRWLISYPVNEKEWGSSNIWLASRPWETGETYRKAQWRRHSVLLSEASPGADKNSTAFKISVTPAGSRAVLGRVSIRYQQASFLERWQGHEKMMEDLFFRQSRLVVDRVRAEDTARQALRASVYAKERGLSIPEGKTAGIEKMMGNLLLLFRGTETLLDRHYYDGRFFLSEGNQKELSSLQKEIEVRQNEIAGMIKSLKTSSEELLTYLQKHSGFTHNDRIEYSAQPSAENIPSYFRKRIRFFAFANSPWSRELWPNRWREGKRWYDLLPLYGIEGIFRITGYSSTEPPVKANKKEPADVIEERIDKMTIPPNPDAPWHASLLSTDKQYQVYSRYGLKTVPAALHLHHMYILGGLPGWFRNKYKDDEYLDRSYEGDIDNKGQNSGTVNIWHPGIKEYVSNYAKTVGRQAAANPDIVAFSTFNEPRFSIRGGSPGYNRYAIETFRKKLEAKYTTIEKLNLSWESRYTSFNEIEPPLPSEKEPWQITPLYYEWMRFKQESLQGYGLMITDAFKSACPDKPVWTEGIMNNVGDIGHTHIRPLPFNNIANYTLRRLHGKTIVDAETGGGHAWEGEQEVEAEVARAATERNLMDAILWGQRGFDFWTRFFTSNASGYYAAFHDDPDGAMVIPVRDCSSIAVIRDKADRFGELLANTEVANCGVGLVRAGSAMTGAPMGADGYWILSDSLYYSNYPPFVSDGDSISNGLEDIGKFKFLIMLKSPVVLPGMNEKLIRWVKDGGTLFAEGPWGVINPYGKSEGQLIREAFGEVDVAFPPDEKQKKAIAAGRMHRTVPEKYKEIYSGRSIGEWFIPIKPVSLKQGVNIVMADIQGNPLIMDAPLGKGRVIMTAVTSYGLGKYIISRIEKEISPPARAEERLYTVIREDGAGNRYLGVVNPDSSNRVDTLITLNREYDSVVDLGIKGKFPVPVVKKDGFTRFRLTLYPGEGTIYSLEK